MRIIASLLLSLLFLSQPLAAGQASLKSVEDGDTLLILFDGQPRRFQIAGIDAPEDTTNPKYQKDLARTGLAADRLLALGRSATRALTGHITAGSPLELGGDLNHKDKYGRTPVSVRTAGGESLGEWMVREGYAIVLKRAPLDNQTRQRLLGLQEAARLANKGLWQTDPEAMALWSGQPRR